MNLLILSDKFGKIIAIGTSICAVISFLWIVFKEINAYNTEKVDVKANTEQITKFQHTVDSLSTKTKELQKQVFTQKIHFEPVIIILNNHLKDTILNGIRFKCSKDKKLFFYYKEGYLYQVAYSQEYNNFYYLSEDGTSSWCK